MYALHLAYPKVIFHHSGAFMNTKKLTLYTTKLQTSFRFYQVFH